LQGSNKIQAKSTIWWQLWSKQLFYDFVAIVEKQTPVSIPQSMLSSTVEPGFTFSLSTFVMHLY
jgi:hypothetical protein